MLCLDAVCGPVVEVWITVFWIILAEIFLRSGLIAGAVAQKIPVLISMDVQVVTSELSNDISSLVDTCTTRMSLMIAAMMMSMARQKIAIRLYFCRLVIFNATIFYELMVSTS
jgi:hypothetical protein